MASIRRQAKDLNNVYSSTTLPYTTTTTTATTWISKTSVWKSIHLFVLVIVLPIVLDSYQTCSRSVLRIFFKNLGGPGRRADCSNHSARKMMMMGWWDDLEKWNRDLYRTVFFSSFTILFFFCRAKNIFFPTPLDFIFLSFGRRTTSTNSPQLFQKAMEHTALLDALNPSWLTWSRVTSRRLGSLLVSFVAIFYDWRNKTRW